MESLTTLDAGFLEAEERAVGRLVSIGAAPRRSSRTGTLFVVPNDPVTSTGYDPRSESATAR